MESILLWLGFLFFVLPIIYIGLLRFINPPFTPLMVQRLLQGYGYKYQWADLENISKHLRYAVIASEDNKFCVHNGFDFQALNVMIGVALKGKRSAGASTISMQTSKNLFLLPQRSFVRKIFEAYYTVWLELLLDKRRIMELYLNIIEFGRGVYGAEAGSQYYYKQSAKKLGLRQATQLVTILPRPLYRMPNKGSRKAWRYERRIKRLGPFLSCVK